ncbi:sensor histidine kinase [Rhodopirellula sp. MGV]|uniref:sensor histidine kinase n=1 Tax=Rhodopirellula sp. MGV TaxID=2023130 RepID=UPI00117B8658|nr:ATP-binding protein [Rhodopirellula sp. MGV]
MTTALSFWVFDADGFPARWHCGSGWSDEPYVGWMHVISDVVTWTAYLAIPVMLTLFVRKRNDVVFPKIFWLFCAFIVSCGTVHLIEAIIFWWPVYRLSAVIKVFTALVSFATAIAMIRILPVAVTLPGLAAVNKQLKREIQTRKETEAELAKMNQDLESFVSIASHDLQEPLRNIISYADLLKQDLGDNLSTDAHQDLAFITSATGRMQRLINDLLTFSRTSRHDATFCPTPLDECVNEALEILHQRIQDSNCTIERTPLPELAVDATLLVQLYQNLISNAIKFTDHENSVIQITAKQVDGVWVMSVCDNGIGIKEEFAEQIFSPFKRLHGMSEYEGTGIGLAICQKVVEHHDGRIWVTSQPGKGSQFHFTLTPDLSASTTDE